jgi:multiple antibiotic resistance protein
MTTLILYSTIYGPTVTLIASLTASALSVATLYLGARLVKLFGPVPAKALGRLLRTRSGKITRRMLKRV